MISLQKFFGKDDTFFDLLEASALEGQNSINALNEILSRAGTVTSLEQFAKPREADKRITEQINEALVKSFVTQLEREDIEVLSAALYRIPKVVEKFAEHYQMCGSRVSDVDFSEHTKLLSAATTQVVALVKMLRTLGSGRIAEAKEANAKLQQIEGEADKLMLKCLREIYSGKMDVTKVLILRDLYELLEKVIDRCRDAGNVVMHIVLKNA